MQENQPNTISIKEFREQGYLQELNRMFLHPLGLSMVAMVDVDGSETIFKVMDAREDPEGYIFKFNKVDPQDMIPVRENADRVQKEWEAKTETRIKHLGYVVEPVN